MPNWERFLTNWGKLTLKFSYVFSVVYEGLFRRRNTPTFSRWVLFVRKSIFKWNKSYLVRQYLALERKRFVDFWPPKPSFSMLKRIPLQILVVVTPQEKYQIANYSLPNLFVDSRSHLRAVVWGSGSSN